LPARFLSDFVAKSIFRTEKSMHRAFEGGAGVQSNFEEEILPTFVQL